MPIEIEDTAVCNYKALQNCLSGQNSLRPYDYISFRVLHQIADVLMNKTVAADSSHFDRYFSGVDIFQQLEDFYK